MQLRRLIANLKYTCAMYLLFGGVPATLVLILYKLNRARRIQLSLSYLVYRLFESFCFPLGLDSNLFSRVLANLIKPLWELNGGKILFDCSQETKHQLLNQVSPNPLLFALSPHGVIPFNWFIALSQFKDKPFALGARLIYKIPGLREVFSTWSIEGSKENFEKLVASGRSTCCLMGGVPEMILSEPGLKIKVFCKNNGFVRLALQNGTDLVPVFAFGENNQWTQRRAPAFVSNFVSKWTGGTYPFFPSGSSWWTLVPHETKVVYVVGEIVKVSRDARNPTEQEIDATHLRFYTQMQQMILRKRKEAGFSNVFVEFVGLEHLNVRPESPELKSFI